MKNNSVVYSQNFLRDKSLVFDLVKRFGIKPDDIVYEIGAGQGIITCLLYTSPSPRDGLLSRMPSSA